MPRRTVASSRAPAGAGTSGLQCCAARNRIKRIVRESFRQHQEQLVGLDVVVMNQPAAKTGSNGQLFDSLSAHWRRCEKAADKISGQDKKENG